jgi:hypothetical protein
MRTYGAGQVDDQGLLTGAASEERDPSRRYRAVRMVASMARDALDASLILDQLGLRAEEGKQG